MVRERGSSPSKKVRVMKNLINIKIAIIGITMFFLCGVALAQEWEEKYDQNTEITLRGKVAEIVFKDRGPVVIGVVRNDKVYNILTGPRWFLEESLYEFRLNDEVVIHGSKYISRKGEIFIIAREIHNISNGKIYVFREDDGFIPKWRQRGKKKRCCEI